MEYYLAHYGVKGMKWGVRKHDYTKTNGKRKSEYWLTYKTRNGVANRRISKGTTRGLYKRGIIDKTGSMKPYDSSRAASFVMSRRALAIAGAQFGGGLVASAPAAAVTFYRDRQNIPVSKLKPLDKSDIEKTKK